MAYLKSTYPYLIVLSETLTDSQLRKKLLNKPKVLNCISELTYNLLKGNIQLTEQEKKKLQKFRKELCKLATKGNIKTKQKLLSGQKGRGILSTLLTIGLPVLFSLLSSKNASNRK